MRKKVLAMVIAVGLILQIFSVGTADISSAANIGELLVSLTRIVATTADTGNKFNADGGEFKDVSELTAWDNNTQITIGGTGRTPIVINNSALTGVAPDNGWKPASVVGVDNASAFQLKFSTAGHEDIKFSATQKSTGSGLDSFKLAYRIGSTGTWVEIPDSHKDVRRVSNDSYDALRQTYLGFELPSAVNNQSEVYLRVYFDGLTDLGRNGNTSINDIRITTGDYEPYKVGERPDYIIINQVYGNGNSGTGTAIPAVSHSFIELYNPTNAPITLTGKSLQYISGISANNPDFGDWQKLDLTGTINANSSYLIVSDVGINTTSAVSYVIPNNDKVWSGLQMSNRAFSVALVNNTTTLTGNPENNTLTGGIIDLIGATNSTANGDIAPYYEYRPFTDISRQAGGRRVNFADYDENNRDFERIDYRTADTSLVRPRYSGDGVWGTDIYPAFRVPRTGQLTFSRKSGFYSSPFSLALDTAIQGGVIRYTTDGSEPTADSPVYSIPISITDRTGIPTQNFTGAPNFTITVEGTVVSGDVRISESDSPYRAFAIATVNPTTRAYTMTRTFTPTELSNVSGMLQITPGYGNYTDYTISNLIIHEAGNASNVYYDIQDDPDLADIETAWVWNKSNFIRNGGNVVKITGTTGNKVINLSGRQESWEFVEVYSSSIFDYLLEGIPHNFLAERVENTPWGNSIARGNTIRARVFDENGNPLTDKIYTSSYFVGLGSEYSDIPVISLTTDSSNLIDLDRGIYKRHYFKGMEWERPVHFEIIEPDGTGGHAQDMGMRMHGNGSRNYPQKPFRLYARSSYDPDNPTMKYDLFDGAAVDLNGSPITSFDRFLLRPTGQDNTVAMMRDAVLQARTPTLNNVLYQAYRPAVVFINGEFWGYYNIRERIDEHFISSHTGVDRRDIGVIMPLHLFDTEAGNAGDEEVDPRDETAYMEMHNWFKGLGSVMTDNEYKKAQTFLDIENFIDYWAFNMILANEDWPNNNVTMWRNRTDFPDTDEELNLQDGRWRHILRDLDFSYALYENTSHGFTPRYRNEIFKLFLEDSPDLDEWPLYGYSTVIFRKLMSNTDFKEAFLLRLMDIINTDMRTSVITNEINALQAKMSPIIPEHFSRWQNNNMANWNSEVDRFRNFAQSRRENFLNEINAYFGYGGNATITINNSNTSLGYVKLNSVDVKSGAVGISNPASWISSYLVGVKQTITAVSDNRHHATFTVNGSPVASTNKSISFTMTGDTIVQVTFAPQACTLHICTECERDCTDPCCTVCDPTHDCCECNPCGIHGCTVCDPCECDCIVCHDSGDCCDCDTCDCVCKVCHDSDSHCIECCKLHTCGVCERVCTLHICTTCDRDCTLHICTTCDRDCTLHICTICSRDCTLHICTICSRDCTLHVCTICDRICTLHVCTTAPCNRTCDLPVCVDCDRFPDTLYISTDNAENGYIELHNSTDNKISSKGMYLVDGNGFIWKMPSVVVRGKSTVKIGIKGNAVDSVLKRMWIDFDVLLAGDLRLVSADEVE